MHYFSPPLDSRVVIVADLINHATFSWKSDTVKRLFNSRDSDLILQIPLRISQGSDSLMWNASLSGNFTVKSAYKVAYALKHNSPLLAPQASSSHAQAFKPLWKIFWSIPTKRKIQFFLWQCAHDRIPVLSNLEVRGIVKDAICKRSGLEPESTFHLLCRCPSSLMVWRISSLRLCFDSICIFWATQWNLLIDSWQPLPNGKSNLSLASFIYWQIWKARNDWHFNSTHWNPKAILDRIMLNFHELSNISTLDTRLHTHLSPSSPPSHWVPPAEGKLKLNIDAAFSFPSKSAGGGFVLRDHKGKTIKVASVFSPFISNPEVAEFHVLREGLSLLIHWGYSEVIIEGD
ncbi:uncharacterized protein LOC132272673 [Cornus florida]|uniref:uncharacterized protein LOC132272673 n=1 Tax=Cornus florida TaxID=4283 RepID=UPI002898D57B|nr:uncharacterized protein LOC132272673 [Cornus florida]